VGVNAHGNTSIDFADAQAVKALNTALLQLYYAISGWDVPAHYLCPPIPGRADYVHYLADLLAEGNGGLIPRSGNIRVLDIGVGANAIYPLIGHREYGWQFVGADIDRRSLDNAQRIVDTNSLSNMIGLRLQTRPESIFQGIVQPDDRFELTMCNPPFHPTLEKANAGTQRKLQGLKASQARQVNKSNHLQTQAMPGKEHFRSKMALRHKQPPTLNFGGQSAELHCPGGELGFIRRMIGESKGYSRQCLWFTTLVSQAAHLPAIYRELKRENTREVRTIDMAQGQKKSRIVAWTFLTPGEHARWQKST